MSNPHRLIKRLAVLTGFCIVACSSVRAQQSYYIYIQSENGQPFYTQIGDKVYSSSAVGHLIISGLKDNVCTFEIGFPQHASRPQQFSVPIKGKDHGFQLKKSGSDWTLVGWQNQETIRPSHGSGTSVELYGERKKDDAFATLMAAVVNDSAVLYTSIVKNDPVEAPAVAKAEDVKKEEVKEEQKTDAAIATPVVPVGQSPDTAKAYKNDKPLYDTTTAVAKVYQNEKPLYDTTAAKPVAEKPATDSLATDGQAYVPEKKPENKQATPGVVKVQETKDKDGQTKLVFIDSSESPANVVTVYISEEKETAPQQVPDQPASSQLTANNAPDTKEKPKPEKKKDIGKKADSIVKNETAAIEPANTKKETVKEGPVNTQATLERTSTSAMKPVAEKPAGKKSDTLIIILESPQMRKDSGRSVKQEAPRPLYEPKQAPQPAAAQHDAEKSGMPATTGISNQSSGQETPVTAKDNVPVTTNQDVPVTSKTTDDLVNTSQPTTHKESAKPAADTEKKTTDPVSPQKDDDVVKQEAPKALYNPQPSDAEKKKLVMINSDCSRFASENDVDKLRVKMLAEKDLQKRVAVANKVFRTMCLYAKQIKALSELFPTDEAKYKFLEMAYPFAADTENFKQLYELFGTEGYQTKFKTLVRY